MNQMTQLPTHTCGTCKYFGREYEHTTYNDDDTETVSNYHVCDLLNHLNSYDSDAPKGQRVAGAIDGSGYHAAFCVTDEFGCNQWQPQQSQTEVPHG